MQGADTHTQVILNLNLLCHMAWTGLGLLLTSAPKECVLTTSGAGARAGDLNYPPPGAFVTGQLICSQQPTPLLNYGHHPFLHENPDFISRIKFLQIDT